MAVIESKGNGYSLFNGVKLPSLPEWDKETYPYVVMAENIQLYLSTVPYNYLPDVGKLFADGGLRAICRLEDGVWVMKNEGITSTIYAYVPVSGKSLWANRDILNTDDNSVYLAASEPISLEGMNVIEWDGDTEGLEQWDTQLYYLVSNKTDVDVEKHYHAVSLAVSTNKTIQKANMSFNTSQAYATASTFARYAGKAYVGSLAKGLYLGGKASGARYTSLFAYYPIEPAEPEQPEIDRNTLFMLYRLFSPTVFHAITGKRHWME